MTKFQEVGWYKDYRLLAVVFNYKQFSAGEKRWIFYNILLFFPPSLMGATQINCLESNDAASCRVIRPLQHIFRVSESYKNAQYSKHILFRHYVTLPLQ